MQFSSMMNPSGGNDGAASFPAPGDSTTEATSTEANTHANANANVNANTNTNAANPFAAMFNPGSNPLASMFGNQGVGAADNQQNQPFDPSMLASLLGGGAAQQKPPNRTIDLLKNATNSELRQLNDMGFFDFEKNVAALRRSGGSVQGALDSLLNGDV